LLCFLEGYKNDDAANQNELMMEQERATKPCPFCAETILADAKKCKHCGEFLDETIRPKTTLPPIRNAPSAGVAAVLSLFIPGAGQLYLGWTGGGITYLLLTIGGYLIFVLPGLLLHFISIIDAASYKSPGTMPVLTPEQITEQKVKARKSLRHDLTIFGIIMAILIGGVCALILIKNPAFFFPRSSPLPTKIKYATVDASEKQLKVSFWLVNDESEEACDSGIVVVQLVKSNYSLLEDTLPVHYSSFQYQKPDTGMATLCYSVLVDKPRIPVKLRKETGELRIVFRRHSGGVMTKTVTVELDRIRMR
jgi:hypothetical protein